MSPVPYFPGREGLLRFTGMERVTDQEGLFIHPLAEGAEAYYRYESGDTISYSLPDGRTIRIVEVNVRAREPAFDLIVGSLWFDLESAQIVRAAYRPAAPFDIKKFVEEEEGEEEFDDVPRVMRPLIFPMVATLEAFTVEYGLYRGRWWLPRLQSLNGRMQVGVMRAPFEVFETLHLLGRERHRAVAGDRHRHGPAAAGPCPHQRRREETIARNSMLASATAHRATP